MDENLVSAVLLPQDLLDIDGYIASMKAKLGFMITLEVERRKSIRKMAGLRTGYVDEVYTGVNSNSQALPQNYDLTEFTKDKDLRDATTLILSKINNEIVEPLDDTILELGHELMEHADHGYALLKIAAKSNEAAKKSVEKISKANPGAGTKLPVITNSVAKGGDVTVTKVVSGSRVINFGDSILELTGTETSGKLKLEATRIAPGGSLRLPAGVSVIYVKNLSAELQGSFSVKIRG